MASGRFPDKDPGDRLDYSVDFTKPFDLGEDIFALIWTVPAGLVKETESGVGTKIASVVLSGGTGGTTYTLVLSVTTTVGSPKRIYERDYLIRVRNL